MLEAAITGELAPAPTVEHVRQYRLLCRAGGKLVAVQLSQVIEVMRPLPIEPLPGAPAFVRGLSIIRGAPVPVVDLALLLGGGATRPGRLIAVRTGNRTVALAAESVSGIWSIGTEQLGELPPLLCDAATEAIDAIGTRDSELLLFLRNAQILPEEVFERLEAEGAQL